MASRDVLLKALSHEEPVTVAEVIRGTKFKYLGSSNVDLYVYTDKNYIDRIIKNNILRIKVAVNEIENKSVRDFYLNNKKLEVNLDELRSKNNIETITLDSLKKERTNEISGENDIMSEMFTYESSVLNKRIINISLNNKELNKEFTLNINGNTLRNPFNFIKRKRISNKIKRLIELKYEPNNNDTKEIVELLHLK